MIWGGLSGVDCSQRTISIIPGISPGIVSLTAEAGSDAWSKSLASSLTTTKRPSHMAGRTSTTQGGCTFSDTFFLVGCSTKAGCFLEGLVPPPAAAVNNAIAQAWHGVLSCLLQPQECACTAWAA
jgi:hypothetical protein